MFIQAYEFSLGQKISPGRVVLGKFDGQFPSLAAAAGSGGKVILQSPHIQEKEDGQAGEESKSLTYLSFNQEMESLSCGPLVPNAQRAEQLFLGSKTNLLVFDVMKNKDVIFREVSEGVNCMTFGQLSGNQKPLLFLGGNCAVQGFDSRGNQAFWTVTSDNSRSICLVDLDADGEKELLVGSNDFAIRAFKSEELLFDINETAKVTNLTPLRKSLYGFGLSSGTAGSYNKKSRIWKTKYKTKINSLCSYDFDRDGVMQLAIGLHAGSFEIRGDSTGELFYTFESENVPFASANKYDYRMEKKDQLICTWTDGSVKGFTATSNAEEFKALDDKEEKMNAKIKLLTRLKKELEMKLKALQDQKKKGGKKDSLKLPSQNLEISFSQELDTKSVIMTCISDVGSVVKSVLIESDELYEGGSKLFSGKQATAKHILGMPVSPPKDLKIAIKIRALVGQSYNSDNFFVYSASVELPRFACYKLVSPDLVDAPKSSVNFSINFESPKRFQQFVDKYFLTTSQGQKHLQVNLSSFKARFISVRDKAPLVIEAQHNGEVCIKCDRMELAAALVQEIAEYFNFVDLNSEANFPHEFSNFSALIQRIDELQSLRTHFSANIADVVNNIKVLVVRAEDARMLRNMKGLKKQYARLSQENNALVAEFNQRNSNHTELLRCLKELNAFIQRGSNLRGKKRMKIVGSAKTEVVRLCREAIKKNQKHRIIELIKRGRND